MLRNKLGKLYRKKIPKDFQSRMDCMRARRHWRRAGAIFIHVPKAAGVTISTALYGTTLGHIAALDMRKHTKEDFNKLFCFSFVREPVDRFYSAIRYLNKNENIVKGGPGLPDDFNILKDPENVVEWILKKNLSEVNYVFKPQCFFICDNNDVILPDYIGRMESIDDSIYFIEEKLNRRIDVRRLNTTHGEEGGGIMSKNLDNIIREIYKKDFELFGY